MVAVPSVGKRGGRALTALVASGLGHAALLAFGLLVVSGRSVDEAEAPRTVTVEFEQAAPDAAASSIEAGVPDASAVSPAAAPEPIQQSPEPSTPATPQADLPDPVPMVNPAPPQLPPVQPSEPEPLEPAQTPPPLAAEPSRLEPAKQLPKPVLLPPLPPSPHRSPSADIAKRRVQQPPKQAGPAGGGAPSATSTAPDLPVPAAMAPAAAQLADGWNGAIAAWLAAHKTYPTEARRRGEEGEVGVRFSVDADGQVTAVSVDQSSGSAMLDAAARSLLTGARLPPPRVPVVRTFRLRYKLE